MEETKSEEPEALYFKGFTGIDIEPSGFFVSLLETLKLLNTADLKVH